jgi:DivIVA domain-containing protein
MLWFFSILIVLVMGAIAVVAAGYGKPMDPATHDRAGRALPDGPVTADGLRRVRFSLAFRGYRMSEVDDLLDRVAARLEAAEAAVEPAQPPEEPH